MIGQLRSSSCATRRRQALGAQFSPRAFHDVVLETGTAPLDILDGKWIATSPRCGDEN